MFEPATNTRFRDAYRRAHEERAAALAGIWRRIVPSAR
jgi:hypothetical protein